MNAPPPADPAPLVALVRRLRGRDRAWTASAAARFDAWLDGLDRDAEARERVSRGLLAIVAGTQQTRFFADLGVSPPDGFGGEIRRRLVQKLLPADHDDDQLDDWLRRLFSRGRTADWVLSVPADRWRRLAARLGLGTLPDEARLRLASETMEAIKIVSARIAAIGVDPRVARVHPDAQRSASPFLEQQAAVRAYVDGWADAIGRGEREPPEDDRPVRVLLDQCREVLRRIRRDTRRTGVTVALTYLLIRLQETIDRLEALLDLVDARAETDARAGAWIRFFRRQVRACAAETRVRDVWRRGTELAALEVVEHAGRTGEHYVAADRAQWVAMGRSAAIGGTVIAFMAIAKVLIAGLHAPPLLEGLLVSLNYGLGFVLIHLLHGTVATKQPAMTAARIAQAIGEGAHERGRRDWVPRVAELGVQVVRSQLVAVAGNVGVALPLAAALVWAAMRLLPAGPVSPEKAALLLGQLDPLGLTVLYAAIAGVCLFLSGVVSGYCDNLAVFHRIPRRVERMPLLVRWAGPARAQAVGRYVEHNLGALAGNFLFGCMLGGVSLLGTLSGAPLDIRHVAFASAHLGAAGVVLGDALPWTAFAIGAVGVAVIGTTNLAVSFTLSLLLALRARRLEATEVGASLREVARRMVARPLDLVRPPPAAVHDDAAAAR